ncbi:MAG: hypothetical protein JSC085_000842 [Candidatus Tokpelaia sp. JSC085]|nr:MAG: hypothetical protein JSC085_000842 [Candidatus Tokpelaia sp. JSC085]
MDFSRDTNIFAAEFNMGVILEMMQLFRKRSTEEFFEKHSKSSETFHSSYSSLSSKTTSASSQSEDVETDFMDRVDGNNFPKKELQTGNFNAGEVSWPKSQQEVDGGAIAQNPNPIVHAYDEDLPSQDVLQGAFFSVGHDVDQNIIGGLGVTARKDISGTTIFDDFFLNILQIKNFEQSDYENCNNAATYREKIAVLEENRQEELIYEGEDIYFYADDQTPINTVAVSPENGVMNADKLQTCYHRQELHNHQHTRTQESLHGRRISVEQSDLNAINYSCTEPPVGLGETVVQISCEEEIAQKVVSVLDQEFADAEEEDYFPTPEHASHMGLPREGLLDIASETPIALVDDKKQRGYKFFYSMMTLVALIALGVGGYFHSHRGEQGKKPAIIYAKQEEIKVKPENPAANLLELDSQWPAVYNHVEGNVSDKVEQKKLIDRTEIPIDLLDKPYKQRGANILTPDTTATATQGQQTILTRNKLDREKDVKDVMPLTVLPDKLEVPFQIAMQRMPIHQSHVQKTAETGDDGTMMSNDFYVQISSQLSQEAAQQSATEARRRFSSLIDSNDIVIVPAVIPNRGTHYRVRIPIGERKTAVQLCEQYKQAGGNCFVGRGTENQVSHLQRKN